MILLALLACALLVATQLIACDRGTCTPQDAADALAAYQKARNIVDRLPGSSPELPGALVEVEKTAARLRECVMVDSH